MLRLAHWRNEPSFIVWACKGSYMHVLCHLVHARMGTRVRMSSPTACSRPARLCDQPSQCLMHAGMHALAALPGAMGHSTSWQPPLRRRGSCCTLTASCTQQLQDCNLQRTPVLHRPQACLHATWRGMAWELQMALRKARCSAQVAGGAGVGGIIAPRPAALGVAVIATAGLPPSAWPPSHAWPKMA